MAEEAPKLIYKKLSNPSKTENKNWKVVDILGKDFMEELNALVKKLFYFREEKPKRDFIRPGIKGDQGSIFFRIFIRGP